MVKQVRILGAMFVAALATAFTVSCSKSDGVGGETNWLVRCSGDSECGDGATCSCGVCTKSCTSAAGCSGIAGSVCAKEGSIPYGACIGAPSGGVCLPSCEGTCDAHSSCLGGVCVPRAIPDGGACTLTCPKSAPLDRDHCRCVPWNPPVLDSGCAILPCPSNTVFNPSTCACIPQSFFDGGDTCEPLPCPSGAPWSQETCSCVGVGETDSGPKIPDPSAEDGGCKERPCFGGTGPWDPVHCACSGGEYDAAGSHIPPDSPNDASAP